MRKDNPKFRFHEYCKSEGIPLVGVSGADPADENFVLHFAPSATKKQIQAANDACHKRPELFGGWKALPGADFAKFEESLIADMTLPVATKMSVPGFVSMLRPLGSWSHRTTLRNLWQQAKDESKSSGWLAGKCSDGKAISSKIEEVAAKCNIPLVQK